MNTEKSSEMKKEAGDMKLHWMAKVPNILEMWQGSQNLRVAQKESCAPNKHRTAVGYISDTEEIVKASWSLFHHDGVAAFTMSGISFFPPAMSAKNHRGGQTKIWNVRRIRRINHHPVECDKDITPDSISDTDNWPSSNGNLDNPNDSEYDLMADCESDIVPNNGIEDAECPEQQDVSATPNVPGLVWPTRKSKRQAENVLVTVNAIETRRNNGVKTM